MTIPIDRVLGNCRDLLYRVFESFDGNFSLQLNDKGVTEAADPSIIGDGGYWVEESFSHKYLTALGGFEDRKGKSKKKDEVRFRFYFTLPA